jgi:hypothetical protein
MIDAGRFGVELFAMIGEDEFGNGDVGLKQAVAPAGIIPMVAIRRDKVEQFWNQYEAQAQAFGKRVYLVRFEAVEVLRETEGGAPLGTWKGVTQ